MSKCKYCGRKIESGDNCGEHEPCPPGCPACEDHKANSVGDYLANGLEHDTVEQAVKYMVEEFGLTAAGAKFMVEEYLKKFSTMAIIPPHRLAELVRKYMVE